MRRYTVRRVRMSGAYETGTGHYYGAESHGSLLYRAVDENGDEIKTIRVANKDEAIVRFENAFKWADYQGMEWERIPDAYFYTLSSFEIGNP